MKLLLLLLMVMYQEPIKKDTAVKQKQITHPKKQGKRKIPYFY